jgi:hypothetical protein
MTDGGLPISILTVCDSIFIIKRHSQLTNPDLSLQVKNVLRENDPSCAKFYDGDVLRQIRISTIQGDIARREKFLARLSNSKQDYVKRLEALPEQFWDSLDALIPFAGLWPAILIGTFLRLSNLHCPEVFSPP